MEQRRDLGTTAILGDDDAALVKRGGILSQQVLAAIAAPATHQPLVFDSVSLSRPSSREKSKCVAHLVSTRETIVEEARQHQRRRIHETNYP